MKKEITRILVFLLIIGLIFSNKIFMIIGSVFIISNFFKIINYSMSSLVNDLVGLIHNK
jgi:hypothetical protein